MIIKKCVYCGEEFEDKDGGRRTVCNKCKFESSARNNKRHYELAISNNLTMMQVSCKTRKYIKDEAKKNKIKMHDQLDRILFEKMC